MSQQHPARIRWKSLAALGLGVLLLSATVPAQAAKSAERAKQKRAAEAERADLQQKLGALKREIDRTESARNQVVDALAHAEMAISDANRALRELSEEQQRTEAKLSQLSQEQSELTKVVEAQQKQLAKLLREQYVAGNEDRIKLLLSGDNPNRINRELQYMGYVSQAQARLIEALRRNLQAVERNRIETQSAKDDLSDIEQEQREQKTLLDQEKIQRAALLSRLSSKLAAQRAEAGNIQRDEQRLAGLVDKLARLIEEQQKADAVAQEKHRQDLAARAQAERDKRARQAKNNGGGASKTGAADGKIKPSDAIDNDEAPAKTLARNELTPLAAVQDGIFPRDFNALRGQLRLPVRGDLIAKYGARRGEGSSWKGLFIRADEGAEVKAIAAGRVVFAEWLRGFGNLIIVDHGSQYMTIYGNNQAVLKRAGDAVKAGDVIANAGNSGGNEQSGLYFEMRHQGRAFDPLGWVTIR